MIDADELVDNEFLRQFEIKVNDNLAKIEYSHQVVINTCSHGCYGVGNKIERRLVLLQRAVAAYL